MILIYKVKILFKYLKPNDTMQDDPEWFHFLVLMEDTFELSNSGECYPKSANKIAYKKQPTNLLTNHF